MEAGWGGTTLRLEGAELSVDLEGQAPVRFTLDALTGFTIFKPEDAEGAHLAFGPGGALVLGWVDGRRQRALSIPMPSPALQVEFFVARLSQLQPGKDLQALPAKDALLKLTPSGSPRGGVVAIVLAIAALLGIAFFALR